DASPEDAPSEAARRDEELLSGAHRLEIFVVKFRDHPGRRIGDDRVDGGAGRHRRPRLDTLPRNATVERRPQRDPMEYRRRRLRGRAVTLRCRTSGVRLCLQGAKPGEGCVSGTGTRGGRAKVRPEGGDLLTTGALPDQTQLLPGTVQRRDRSLATRSRRL